MIKRGLTVLVTLCVFMSLGILGTGCAKKPKVPEVEETKKEVKVRKEKPKPEPEVEAKPLFEEEKPYEGFKPVEEPPTEVPKKVFVDIQFEDIHFDFDKYDIRWNDKGKLQDMAKTLKENSGLIVTIEGHCDERGTNAYNRALGDKRANAVREFLYSLGIMKSRTTVVSYGEEKPLCTEHNEDCWWKNRRAHFLVTGSGG